MTVKVVAIIIYLITFVISLFRIIYFSKVKKSESKQEVHTASVVLAIVTLVFGIGLIVISCFTDELDEKIVFGSKENTTEEQSIQETNSFDINELILGDVYNISNITYSVQNKSYTVAIDLADQGIKLIEISEENLTLYNTILESENEYIELYKDASKNKVYLKNTTIDKLIKLNDIQSINLFNNTEDTLIEETNIKVESTETEVVEVEKSEVLNVKTEESTKVNTNNTVKNTTTNENNNSNSDSILKMLFSTEKIWDTDEDGVGDTAPIWLTLIGIIAIIVAIICKVMEELS